MQVSTTDIRIEHTRTAPMTALLLAALPLLALALVLAQVLWVSSAHAATSQAATSQEARWQQQAQAATITRDDWGIAHVHGKTDADAVFGMIYAQAEDDFNRVESNYLTALGRTAEAEGKAAIWSDLRQKLFIDPEVLKQNYTDSPAWLRALMDAWADGLNYYLATHPEVQPKVITQFEPWMALSFTEGSIGGDIERVSLQQLALFYDDGQNDNGRHNGDQHDNGRQDDDQHDNVQHGDKQHDDDKNVNNRAALAFIPEPASWQEPTGSNGIAIAPALTVDGHALLLINPHTSFFFRSELHMSSDAGLDAYGAVTWGQFFVYQGFNRHAGWMHTSTGADVVDEFAETIVRQDDKLSYRYGKDLRAVTTRTINVAYKADDGSKATCTFTAYFTHHGPIVRKAGDKWIAMALMNTPIPALKQSWLRTKTTDYVSYMEVAELMANSSNNTLFADDQGNIAYLHPQFIPLRDDRFDYTKPVDGSDPATDWQGLTPLDQVPNVVNPPNGWAFNTNNWPYSAAGENSPKQADFPRYMDTFGENPRGLNATRLLTGASGFTVQKLITDAFDSYLPAFERQIPPLLSDYDALAANDPLKAKLAGPIALLRNWDYRWGIASMPTSLAVFWGDTLWSEVSKADIAEGLSIYDYMAENAGTQARLQALSEAVNRLQSDFGSWGTAWGEINRFQRINGDIVQPFDDSKPSIPVPFVSSRWGSLASFGAHRWPGTKRYYGTSGNSFVAVVEFGPKVQARAITAGGESGDPQSPHFNDQAERYTTGNLRNVYFWPEQLQGHTERVYHPGS